MFNNHLMQTALLMAEKALHSGEIPVGAIIVDPSNNQIIAQNYNLVEKNNDPTSHAEMLAIQAACQTKISKNLTGLDLYVTLQPCVMCLQAMVYARIRRVYFGAYDARMPMLDVMSLPSNNHVVEIYGGILEEKSKNLLDRFFKEKRL